MAKIPHEALHHLFRDDPGLFTRSVRRLFDEGFLLIEPQGEPPSPQKIRSWAWYLSFLENKYGIPASLLVITAKASTARACRGSITLGPARRPVMRLDPHVIGPDNMPLITDADQAAEDVIFSVFALLTQRLNPEVEQAMGPLMSALETLDTDTARYYAEFVEGGLGKGCQREIWKKIMKTMTYGYVSELKQEFREEGREEGREQGRAEGEATVLLTVLDARGLDPTETERERIRNCTDHEQLLAWTVRAATATSTAEVFES